MPPIKFCSFFIAKISTLLGLRFEKEIPQKKITALLTTKKVFKFILDRGYQPREILRSKPTFKGLCAMYQREDTNAKFDHL